MSPEQTTEHRGERRAPRVTTRSSIVVGIVLMVLWGSSWGLSYVALGPWSLVIALAIAFAKAILVVLVFMELIEAPASSNALLLAAVALMGVLFTLTLLDIDTRAREPMTPSEMAHDQISSGP